MNVKTLKDSIQACFPKKRTLSCINMEFIFAWSPGAGKHKRKLKRTLRRMLKEEWKCLLLVENG